MRTYDDFIASNIRAKVYNALAQISFEEDASENEMEKAIDWFLAHFYVTDGDN